jgi:NAD(P)-dependent dehydrogenase (short-subunit alcohol dehydrogenase family)
LPSLLLAKHLHGKFRHGRPAIFATVSAKVGSIEDNRLGGWVSYRASKAALNMCLKTLAIEWQRTLPNVAVTALHPGTTDTALSRPFQRNVPREQLFTPKRSVSGLLNVLDNLKPSQTGQFFAFDGERLAW